MAKKPFPDQASALKRYKDLMQIIDSGAYSESSEDGSCWYPDEENGFNVSEEIDDLDERARNQGIIFRYDKSSGWTLEPMTEEEKAEWADIQRKVSEEIVRQVEHELHVSQVTRSSFSSDEAYEAWEQDNR